MTVSGAIGELRWGYRRAGTVGAWTIQRVDGVWRLEATLARLQMPEASQRPLAFVVTHQHGTWQWPIETLHVADGQLEAVLGPRR